MMKTIPALLASLLLAACATTGMSDGEKAALYEANAGESVRSFRYLGRLSGWTALGDSAVAVWTRPREAWLLDLSGPCPDLPYAHSIAITSNMNTVHVNFDKVRPISGTPSMNVPCHIRQIRPLDVAAIREAERDMRQGGEVVDEPRADQSPDSGT